MILNSLYNSLLSYESNEWKLIPHIDMNEITLIHLISIYMRVRVTGKKGGGNG